MDIKIEDLMDFTPKPKVTDLSRLIETFSKLPKIDESVISALSDVIDKAQNAPPQGSSDLTIKVKLWSASRKLLDAILQYDNCMNSFIRNHDEDEIDTF